MIYLGTFLARSINRLSKDPLRQGRGMLFYTAFKSGLDQK